MLYTTYTSGIHDVYHEWVEEKRKKMHKKKIIPMICFFSPGISDFPKRLQ